MSEESGSDTATGLVYRQIAASSLNPQHLAHFRDPQLHMYNWPRSGGRTRSNEVPSSFAVAADDTRGMMSINRCSCFVPAFKDSRENFVMPAFISLGEIKCFNIAEVSRRSPLFLSHTSTQFEGLH